MRSKVIFLGGVDFVLKRSKGWESITSLAENAALAGSKQLALGPNNLMQPLTRLTLAMSLRAKRLP